ncbi:MAG: 2'-5' RNA ligase family protein [Myxacorys californica WJT36-NPBG1]|jgi:2'-5' RNA ligase|nr:2'-5' RNA ligase family protein [Myxacorys californica WJT36-NPBG1]
MSSPPLVLTLKLDQSTFDGFNELRQQHFPPARNFIPAHISLFHALPGEQESSIRQTLQTLCSQTPTLSLEFPKPRFLGKGVAVEVQAPELVRLHQRLATQWSDWLTAQDRQGYRPHITIQNKVASDDARQLYEQLTDEWKRFNGVGEGLLLWQYQGGPWALVEEFLFQGTDVSSSNASPARPHSATS